MTGTVRTRLTDAHIARLRPRDREYTVWDTRVAGLGVRVRPSGSASFVLLRKAQGRTRRVSLGPTASKGVDEVRRACHALLAAPASHQAADATHEGAVVPGTSSPAPGGTPASPGTSRLRERASAACSTGSCCPHSGRPRSIGSHAIGCCGGSTPTARARPGAPTTHWASFARFSTTRSLAAMPRPIRRAASRRTGAGSSRASSPGTKSAGCILPWTHSLAGTDLPASRRTSSGCCCSPAAGTARSARCAGRR